MGFNGAAACEPRRQDEFEKAIIYLSASMGPRLVSRGDRNRFAGRCSADALQWGRGL